jgi:hypothetical protein
MLIIDEEEKNQIITETCKKLDITNFKIDAIQSEFKNLNKKLHDYNYIKKLNIENCSIHDMIQLERTYVKLYKTLKSLSNKENIDLFEDQDITYFIKYYNVTFEEDNKPFIVEI